jgi:hypothetical protein
MGKLMIRDNAVWAKHIEDDPEIVRRIEALPQNGPINLLIDGKPVRFVKMRDGKDGRPTPGLRPDPAFKPFWDAMQQQRGQAVQVQLEGPQPVADPYLVSVAGLLMEWSSREDAEAYDDL